MATSLTLLEHGEGQGKDGEGREGAPAGLLRAPPVGNRAGREAGTGWGLEGRRRARAQRARGLHCWKIGVYKASDTKPGPSCELLKY